MTNQLPIPTRVLLACDFHLKYSARLARALAERGLDVAYLTRDHDLEFAGRPGEMRKFVSHHIEDEVQHFVLRGRVRSRPSVPSTIENARRVRRFGPDVVHFQDGVFNDPRLVAASLVRPRRFAITIHDPVPHPGDSAASSLSQRLRRRSLGRAGLIFVHGEALRDELAEHLAPRSPIVVVPHGVDPYTVSPPPRTPSLLFFGRLSHYKGLDTLLDAMPVLWTETPEVTLTVAGDGPLVEHPVLSDPRVKLRHEHVREDEVPDLFESCTALVLPYRQASQSGVGSLARRHARPIVATRTGSLPELTPEGTGLIVPPEDPAALARALTEIVRDPARAEAMGRRGAEQAEASAGWPRIAELTADAYERYLVRGRLRLR